MYFKYFSQPFAQRHILILYESTKEIEKGSQRPLSQATKLE